MNGSSDSEGIVEVCYQGVWTTVVGYMYYWGYYNARVLCRQLGYHDKCEQKSQVIKIIDINNTGAVALLSSSSGITLYKYYCNGNEASLQSCSKSKFNFETQDTIYWFNKPIAAVECQQTNINISSKTLMCQFNI